MSPEAYATVRSKAVVLLLFINFCCVSHCLLGFKVSFLFCFALLCVRSSFVIILRE